MTDRMLEGEQWPDFIRRVHRRDQMREFPDWYKAMNYTEKLKIVAQVRSDVWRIYDESFFMWTFNRHGYKIGYAIYTWQNQGLSERGKVRRANDPQRIGEYHTHTDVVGGYDIQLSGEADCKLWAWMCVWTNRFKLGIPQDVIDRGLTSEEFEWQLNHVFGVQEPKSTIQ